MPGGSIRIGVDAKCLAKSRAGVARYVRSVLDALARIDRHNEYILFEKQPAPDIAPAPHFKRLLLPSRLPGTLWLQTTVPPHVRRLNIDVLWCPEQIVPVWNFPAATARVATALDLTFRHYPRTMQPTNYWIFRLLFKASVRSADRIVAISDFTRRDLIHEYSSMPLESKTSVAHCGPPDWRIPDEYRADRRGAHLLYVGSVEPRKNLLAALEALSLLRREGLTVQLRIVAPGGWKNSGIGDFISSAGIRDQVSWEGFKDEQSLVDEYLACKALIYPSLLEGFGLPVLEALATDTLVLTSRGTVMEEIGGSAVVLFDPANPRDIADTIARTCRPDFRREDFLRRAPDVLARFSWEESARKHLEAFSSAVALKRRKASG